MGLADLIEAHKERLIEAWKRRVGGLLLREREESELVNDLPEFIDDLAAMLRTDPEAWPSIESAARHGRHRVRDGGDGGRLVEEMAMVGDVLLELAEELASPPSSSEMRCLLRAIGRGTADSVAAFASMRDRQLAAEAARHFSFVAHEIRNPLNTAHLAWRLLAHGDPAQRAVYLARIERSLHQLSELVDSSLMQMRLSGRIGLAFQRTWADELVQAAYEDVATQAERRQIAIDVEVERFDLDADPKSIVAALTNLLTNAVKFTCERGRITVRAWSRDGRAYFEVEDQCGGLPHERVTDLFRPFVQAGGDRSGFGLGLTIVEQAAASHGGSVSVENHPGKGCVFCLDLPRRPGIGRQDGAGGDEGETAVAGR